MKISLKNNWPAKLASLCAAIAIWFLVKQHIGGDNFDLMANIAQRDQQFRSDLSRDQIEMQQTLQKLHELQKRINDKMLETAPKAIPVPAPDPEKQSTTPAGQP